MKEFFAKKPLSGKVNTLNIITNSLAMVLVLGAIFGLSLLHYKNKGLSESSLLAKIATNSLSRSLPPADREEGDKALSEIFAYLDPDMGVQLFVDNELRGQFLNHENTNDINLPMTSDAPPETEELNGWTAHVAVPFVFTSDRKTEAIISIFASVKNAQIKAVTTTAVFALIAITSVILALLAGRKLQRFISDPLLLLAEATEKIANEKNFSMRVYSPSKDEIGLLYEGFNRMLEEVEHRDEMIRKTNEQLEDRVKARTSELVQAHAETESINNQLLETNEKLKASIEEAKQLAVEAQAASKAKSEFLAAMSHEIRTPMNGVIGFTNLLLDSSLDETQRDYANTIKSSGESLLVIINDILDFSKIEAGKFFLDSTPFDMAATCNEVVELLSEQANAKNLELKLFYEPDARKHLVGDPGRTKQVLINLLSNAIKFTESGFIHVRVEKTAVDKHPDGLKISVTDTGIGIPTNKQNLLFEKFSQTDASTTRKYGGTGLGLAICKELVTLMNGQIGFKSQEGNGSVFWFTLPAWEFASDLSKSATEPNRLAQEGSVKFDPNQMKPLPEGFTVLLVEDNTVNQKLAAKILSQMGCHVDLAINGKEAVAMARKQSYDIIFMDCQMPEMDGYEATRRIRDIEFDNKVPETERVPIIAITANAMRGDREKCLEEGMNDYIAKPIDAGQIGQLIEKWRHKSNPSN
ncbi:MAG: ATP-binding protein [Verrucomicrobia bacterium]|jgi:signal transduction histidine kinase/ActR/RegA family two-component response regulator|nr:ATP-binding protein [Verrucomicrobiota bacterium]